MGCEKMAVQDEILELIQERFSEDAVTASEIGDIKGLSRNTVSHHLNRLAEEGRLFKIKEKPTKFLLKNVYEEPLDPFGRIVGYEGSMQGIIRQCKASVAYPNGLPLILNGPSGTGKSFIAEVIYEYAKETKKISAKAPFVVLNCADYANNPELLSSVLFGHIKGAFTGAEKEKRGLLDEANEGFLFLDEVHNLSPENQEKLFLLIDSGRFRRLGDNERWIKTKVRLIMATTEDPRSAMLATFRRRIPYEIVLPKFYSRPYNERMELVENFFVAECRGINRPLRVDNELMKRLARTDFEGNIGELKNKIKVLVADELPGCPSGEVKVPMDAQRHSSLFDPKIDYNLTPHRENANRQLRQLVKKCDSFGALREELSELVYLMGEISQGDQEGTNRIDFLASRSGTFKEFSIELFRKYGFRIEDRVSRQLENMMRFCVVYGYDLKDLPSLTNMEKLEYRKHVKMSRKFLQHLFYQHPLLEQFTTLMTSFLLWRFPITSKINAVIIMHGKNNSATIAATVNEMVGDYVFDHFDMPLTVDTGEIIRQVVTYTREINTNQGLVILVDMGSLEKIYSNISGNVSGDLIVMNNTSTALALEVGMKLFRNTPIKQLEELNTAPYQVSKQYFEGVSQKLNILVSCMSGEGIAVKLKDILLQYIGNDVDVLTIDYIYLKEKVDQLDQVFFKNTLQILTTPRINNDQLPILSIEEIVSDQDALSSLNNYMTPEGTKDCVKDILKFFTIEGAASRLSFLNPERVIDEVGDVIGAYEKYYSMEFPNFVRINLFLHLSSMIERILKFGVDDESSEYIVPKTEEFMKFCDFSEAVFKEIIGKYNISIPLSEYGLVYQLVKQSVEQ